jgi:RNA processing factor Prp31
MDLSVCLRFSNFCFADFSPCVDIIAQLDLDATTAYKNLQEWYGWHLPELAQIVQDPTLYCRVIRIFGLRQNFELEKLTSVLGNTEAAAALMSAAAQSELPDLTPEDTRDVQQIASEILTIIEQKQQLGQWLQQKQQQ